MKRNKFRNIWNKVLCFSTAALLTVFGTGCGGKEETGSELPEYTYVPQYIELDQSESFYQAVLVGEWLYNQSYEYEEDTDTSICRIVRYPLEEGKLGQKQEVVSFVGNSGIMCFTVDEKENVYCVESRYPEIDREEEITDEYYEQSQTFLTKYNTDGDKEFEENITGLLAEEGEMFGGYIDRLVADKEGRVYACCNDNVKLFDEKGSFQGQLQVEGNYLNSIGCGKDGKVYISYYDNMSADGGCVLSEIDYGQKKVAKSYQNFVGGNSNSLLPGISKDFIVQDSSNVYEYDLKSQTLETLFSWLDCDINGSYVDNMSVTDDGRVVVITNDWESGESDLVILNREKTSELPQKEILTLGTLYDNQSMQAAVVAFNKASDKYRIRVKTYIDANSWSETSYSDALSRLNNDIASGKNCPDIIDISTLNIKQLATKGVFEDLTPFLENSTLLNKEDYLESVLEGFTYNGTLVTIPYSFCLQTLMGKTEDVGEKMGWTLEQMMNFCEKHPGAQLIDYATKQTILFYCLLYNEEAFIDWEKGTCDFESDEFKQLLAFVNSFPDEYDWESDTRSTPEKIAAGDVLLNMAYINSYDEMQHNLAVFNQKPVTCIGFPDISGGSGCLMTVEDTYAISSKSKNKEGAWEFIESMLSKETGTRGFSRGLSTRKSEIAKQRKEALSEENGNSGGGVVIGGDGGFSYTYRNTTEEEADMLDRLIAVAKPANYNYNEELITIITEEAEGYYRGQKSVDDVTKVIQSRIKLFLDERQ